MKRATSCDFPSVSQDASQSHLDSTTIIRFIVAIDPCSKSTLIRRFTCLPRCGNALLWWKVEFGGVGGKKGDRVVTLRPCHKEADYSDI